MIAITNSTVDLRQIFLFPHYLICHIDQHIASIFSVQFFQNTRLTSGNLRYHVLFLFFDQLVLVSPFCFYDGSHAAFCIVWRITRSIIIFLQFIIHSHEGDGESSHFLRSNIGFDICVIYFDLILMKKSVQIIIYNVQFQKRCGTQSIYKNCNFVPFLQIHLFFQFSIHTIHDFFCRSHLCTFDPRLTMNTHAIFHLIICQLKGRFLIAWQCTRKCGNTDTVYIISCLFCNTNHFVQIKSSITCSSCNFDHEHISCDSTSVRDSLLRCRCQIIPHTHMRRLDTLSLQKLLCHIKVQIITCITSIYKQNAFSLIY